MKNLTWEQEIERLLQLMDEGLLSEDDYDEVAEKHNATRDEVIACCIVESADREIANGIIEED